MLKNFALVGAILFRTSSRIDTNLIVNPRKYSRLGFRPQPRYFVDDAYKQRLSNTALVQLSSLSTAIMP